MHPVPVLHPLVVHGLLSSQISGVPKQLPLLHLSIIVQALPSLHKTLLFDDTQPTPAMQKLSVHGLPSSQFFCVPTQDPFWQESLMVQGLPSLHPDVLYVWTHPVARLQESSVQGLASSQTSPSSPTQVVPWQWSFAVHWLPSLHPTEPLAHAAAHGLAAAPTQYTSHEVLQQNGSRLHTQLWQAALPHPGVLLATLQSPLTAVATHSPVPRKHTLSVHGLPS